MFCSSREPAGPGPTEHPAVRTWHLMSSALAEDRGSAPNGQSLQARGGTGQEWLWSVTVAAQEDTARSSPVVWPVMLMKLKLHVTLDPAGRTWMLQGHPARSFHSCIIQGRWIMRSSLCVPPGDEGQTDEGRRGHG